MALVIFVSTTIGSNCHESFVSHGIDSRKAEVAILGKLRAPFWEFGCRLLFCGLWARPIDHIMITLALLVMTWLVVALCCKLAVNDIHCY